MPFRLASMDFIDGLPKSLGKDSTLVAQDRLSKYAHFLPLSILLLLLQSQTFTLGRSLNFMGCQPHVTEAAPSRAHFEMNC